jgi:hypothetical protein
MDGRVALVPWADMLNHSPEVFTKSSSILYSSISSASPTVHIQRIIMDIGPNSLRPHVSQFS